MSAPGKRRRGGLRLGIVATPRKKLQSYAPYRQPPRELTALDRRVLAVLTDHPEKRGEVARKAGGATSQGITGVLYKLSARGLAIQTDAGWRKS